MSDPTSSLSTGVLQSASTPSKDGGNPKDNLTEVAELAQQLSELITSSDIDAIAPTLQLLLQKLQNLDPQSLCDTDIEEAFLPTFSVLTMLLELGQSDEQYSPLTMLIWKSYPRLIKRYQSIIDGATINRFYEILLPYCEEGLGMVITAVSETPSMVDNADYREASNLLKFFIQKLSITLIYCHKYLSEEIFLHGFRQLMIFLGILNRHPTFFDSMETLRTNCKQSIAKILQESSPTRTSAVSQLDAESQLITIQLDQIDLKLLRESSNFQFASAPSSTVNRTSYFLWFGILDYISELLQVFAADSLNYSQVVVMDKVIQTLEITFFCLASINLLPVVANKGQSLKHFFIHLISSARTIMTSSECWLYIWDYLLLQACGQSSQKMLTNVLNRDLGIATVARVVLLGVFDGVESESQSLLFDRAKAIVCNDLGVTSHHQEMLQQLALQGLIQYSPIPNKKQTLHKIQEFVLGSSKVVQNLPTVELLARALPVQELLQDMDVGIKSETLEVIRTCVQYTLNASEKSSIEFERFAVALTVIRSAIEVQTSVADSALDTILNQFVAKPVVGTVLLRYIQALAKQFDYYWSAKGLNSEWSHSALAKQSSMLTAVTILLDCLRAHRIPNQVRSMLSKNVLLFAKHLSVMFQKCRASASKANSDTIHMLLFRILQLSIKSVTIFIDIYSKSEVTDEIFQSELGEYVTFTSQMITLEKDSDITGNLLWEVQQDAILLLSKLIRLHPKRAGVIAKMMGSQDVVSAVKSYHLAKRTSQLSRAPLHELDEERHYAMLSSALQDHEVTETRVDITSTFVSFASKDFEYSNYLTHHETTQNKKRKVEVMEYERE